MTQVMEPPILGDEAPRIPMPGRYSRPTILFGSRADVVRLAPLVSALDGEVELLQTGWSEDADPPHALLAEFGLRGCVNGLGTMSLNRAGQLSAMVRALDEIFTHARPGAVIVDGSGTTALAGALAAHDRGITLINTGAGARHGQQGRSRDHTQIMIDHRSNMLCATTVQEVENLLAEGIRPDSILCAGSTVIDAVRASLPDRTERRWILHEYGLLPDGYVLAGITAPEHITNFDTLSEILSELNGLAIQGHHVVLPAHPRMITSIADAGLSHLLSKIHVLEPVAYRNHLALASHAGLIVSDDPDTQLEVSVLKRPLVAIGNAARYPDVMGTFGRLVPVGPRIGQTTRACLDNLMTVHRRLVNATSPYGSGGAAAKIAAAIKPMLGRF